jgi:hypothetical protein
MEIKICLTLTFLFHKSVKLGFFSIWEDYRLKIFVNTALMKVFGPKREKQQDTGDKCIIPSFMIYSPYQMLFG